MRIYLIGLLNLLIDRSILRNYPHT